MNHIYITDAAYEAETAELNANARIAGACFGIAASLSVALLGIACYDDAGQGRIDREESLTSTLQYKVSPETGFVTLGELATQEDSLLARVPGIASDTLNFAEAKKALTHKFAEEQIEQEKEKPFLLAVFTLAALAAGSMANAYGRWQFDFSDPSYREHRPQSQKPPACRQPVRS